MNKPSPRFPGAQPFEERQQFLFFGRDEATETLFQLIRQEQLVVLYGKSGMGKSSLLNAGLVPKLRQQGKLVPLRVRFNAFTGEENMPAIATREVVRNGKSAIDTFLDKLIENDESLWHDIKEQQIVSQGTQSILLIFDQFEELFTYPQEAQLAFRKQLAEALFTSVPQRYWDVLDLYEVNQSPLKFEELKLLQQPLDLRVIIAIRQDRMHLLGNLCDYLPNINKNWYELEPLNEKAALLAIQKPASAIGNFSSSPFSFSEEAIRYILQFLTKNGSQKIENTQLQIVCNSLEKKTTQLQTTIITEDLIGNLDAVLENYYEEKIASVADIEQREAARRLVEKGLIFEEEQRRLSMYEGQIFKEYQITLDTLRTLVDSHLLRAEPSMNGGYLYELSHDTIVPAVLNAKRRSDEIERKAREKQDQFEREREIKEERKKRIRAKQYAFVLGIVAVCALTAGLFAYSNLNNLRKANSSVVELMLEDADSHILELRYEDALNTIKGAEKLKGFPSKMVKAYLEIAFFFGESGQKERAIGVLDTLANINGTQHLIAKLKSKTNTSTPDKEWLDAFRATLTDLDSIRFQEMVERYYPVMVDVAGGNFPMSRNGTTYTVEIGNFKLSKTEITYWQWKLFCVATSINDNRRGQGLDGNHPAVNVDWLAAVDYCNWLNRQWGHPNAIHKDSTGAATIHFEANAWRLPSEAEWEFAARGGTKGKPSRYAGGDILDSVGWCRANSSKQTHPVGLKWPNALGLYDMSGNVDEWCWDAYFPNDYKTLNFTPKKGSRIVRGGHFDGEPVFAALGSSDRQNTDNAKESIGFRVAFGMGEGIPKFVLSHTEAPKTEEKEYRKLLPNNQFVVGKNDGFESYIIPFIENPNQAADKTSWFRCDGIVLKQNGRSIDVKESYDQLLNIVKILTAFPKVELKIGGYTDSDGEEADNIKISDECANTVLEALVSMGVPEERLRAEGYGEQYPLCQANDTPQCKAQNRRISIRISKK